MRAMDARRRSRNTRALRAKDRSASAGPSTSRHCSTTVTNTPNRDNRVGSWPRRVRTCPQCSTRRSCNSLRRNTPARSHRKAGRCCRWRSRSPLACTRRRRNTTDPAHHMVAAASCTSRQNTPCRTACRSFRYNTARPAFHSPRHRDRNHCMTAPSDMYRTTRHSHPVRTHGRDTAAHRRRFRGRCPRRGAAEREAA